MENYAFAQTVHEFLHTELRVWGQALKTHHLQVAVEDAPASQVRAWATCHAVRLSSLVLQPHL